MPDPEEGDDFTFSDYALHFLSFYWKLLIAFVPPTKYWGGWATFLVSLAMTGLITAIVGDLAGMFGCIIGLKKSVTAITFIAIGTSLPDTFASKLAA
jgi:solute carrier family 8 (sodium/calcium exchanger)